MTVQSVATDGKLLTVHPTFLYESIWNAIGLVLALILYRKKKFDGQIVLFYLAWYGLGRFFIEGLRADSLMLGNTDIRVSQLLALLTFVFAIITFIVVCIRKKSEKSRDVDYEPQFTAVSDKDEAETAESKCENTDTSTETTEE